MTKIEQRTIASNGIELNVALAGEGPTFLLLHGWPHTWQLWREVIPQLVAAGHRVIAPDLRGLGGSTRVKGGYDLETLAQDMVGLLDRLHVRDVVAVGLDLGAPVAFMLAMRHPDRVSRLVVSESLLGDLPGAEEFLSHGAPWWFGFHGVPGLAESVLEGHEAGYLEWFYRNDSRNGSNIEAELFNAFVSAYTGRESLRCGFDHYRAFPQDVAQIRAALARGHVIHPTMAMIGGVVGDAIYKQLQPICDDLRRVEIPNCGHVIPLEQPELVAKALIAFVSGGAPA